MCLNPILVLLYFLSLQGGTVKFKTGWGRSGSLPAANLPPPQPSPPPSPGRAGLEKAVCLASSICLTREGLLALPLSIHLLN